MDRASTACSSQGWGDHLRYLTGLGKGPGASFVDAE